MRSRRVVLRVDLGATTIKAGLVVDGRVEARAEPVPTVGNEGAAAVIDRVVALVDRLAPPGAPVGIGSCGFLDAQGRIVFSTRTMRGWQGTDLQGEIQRRTGRRTVADNDGNAAALGEARHGAGLGFQSVAMLTLGTGVGGGFVLNGAIVRGAGEVATTFGHLKVGHGGRRCPCEARGCLEAYASATALDPRRKDAARVFQAARHGDRRATRLVDRAADALGAAFTQIAYALNPDIIIIGGGIAASWPQMRKRAVARFREGVKIKPAFQSTQVAAAALGTDAGIVGAACLVEEPPRRTSSRAARARR